MGTAKQRISKLVRRAQLRHVDHVITAGQRTSDYARKLGFSSDQITEGVYAWDEQLFRDVAAGRGTDASVYNPKNTPPGPNSFLFVGRYVPEKGMADLLDAYARYRRTVADPWPLTCCGTGPLAGQLRQAERVQDRGFQAPDAIPAIMRQSEGFIFPSTYEPWGVAFAEAMGAGLPAISTDACGAARDLILHNQNGQIIPPSNPDALLQGMLWLHHHPDRASLGREASHQAQRFTTAKWAERWHKVFTDLLENRSPVSKQ
ncbi:glycosyltransferase family 4 protein [Neorhodopirellula lusitana]|nr:glycosyltransferase family 4 protein [Neorhodopirellula lusitana]